MYKKESKKPVNKSQRNLEDKVNETIGKNNRLNLKSKTISISTQIHKEKHLFRGK